MYIFFEVKKGEEVISHATTTVKRSRSSSSSRGSSKSSNIVSFSLSRPADNRPNPEFHPS